MAESVSAEKSVSIATLNAICDCLSEQKNGEVSISQAVAAKADPFPVILEGLTAAQQHQELRLQTLSLLLQSPNTRSQFAAAQGASKVMQATKAYSGKRELVQAVAYLIEAAATACEDNKTGFMEAGVGKFFAAALEHGQSPETVHSMSRAVRRLTTADDSRPVVSRAFQNSRALATSGLHLAFLTALKQDPASAEGTAACCAAMKKLAANDELCSQLAEAGCVKQTLEAIASHASSASVCSAGCSLLRQMAGSDAIKEDIVQARGLQAVAQVLGTHCGNAGAMEQALGLVAAVTLRFPRGAEAAVQAGLADEIIQVMEAAQQQWVQRQGCMALRNLVARNPEHRPLLLEKSAESTLRGAKKNFPAACGDVGSAALRDLGIEDYNS